MSRILFIAFIFFMPSTSWADVTYFSWTSSGSTRGTGVAANLTASYTLLPSVTQRTYTSNRSSFVNDYGAVMPGFEISSDSSLSGSFTFSSPLPAGSLMIILDIDNGETMRFSADTPLALIEHTERLQSGSSNFPTWSNASQSITAISNAQSDSAATVINVSGLTQLSFHFTNSGGTGTSISFGVVTDPGPLLGDVNLDGVVDFLDISPFITLLSSGTFQTEADIDESSVVDFLDISLFISILSGQ